MIGRAPGLRRTVCRPSKDPAAKGGAAGHRPAQQIGRRSGDLARIRLSLAAAVLALALPAAAHAATYTVSVGSPPTAHVPGAFAAGLFEGDGFYPGGLQIHRGDSVKFVGGFHTATIL